MRNIKNIVLLVCSRYLEDVRQQSDNFPESKYYKDLTKEEKKLFSDYLVNKYIDYWEDMEEGSEKTIYYLESIKDLLSDELMEMSGESDTHYSRTWKQQKQQTLAEKFPLEDKGKWKKAFTGTSMSDETKKELYARYEKELKEPIVWKNFFRDRN